MRVLNRVSHRRFDPWREFARMQSDVERLLGEFNVFSNGAAPQVHPAVNLYKVEHGLVATAELPGVDPASLEVVVEGDVLTLKGKYPDDAAEGETFRRRERPRGAFERRIVLPFAVASDSTAASFQQGLLTVQLDKPVEARPRRIAVKADPS
jgi:HSP20 family protein